MQIQILNVKKPEEIENAFASMVRGKVGALTVLTQGMFVLNRAGIIKLAAKSRLPAMYPDSRFTDAGGLMSYGPNNAELYRRAAYFVDRILKGAKPADLPVEQPTKFELVINLKTAQANRPNDSAEGADVGGQSYRIGFWTMQLPVKISDWVKKIVERLGSYCNLSDSVNLI